MTRSGFFSRSYSYSYSNSCSLSHSSSFSLFRLSSPAKNLLLRRLVISQHFPFSSAASRKKKKLQMKPILPSGQFRNCLSSVDLIASESADSSFSLMLQSPPHRFLFNAPEGLQRVSRGFVRISKLSHVFLTRVAHRTANGLPGLLLTLQDIGSNNETQETKKPIDNDGKSNNGSDKQVSENSSSAPSIPPAASSPSFLSACYYGPRGLYDYLLSVKSFSGTFGFNSSNVQEFRPHEKQRLPVPNCFLSSALPPLVIPDASHLAFSDGPQGISIFAFEIASDQQAANSSSNRITMRNKRKLSSEQRNNQQKKSTNSESCEPEMESAGPEFIDSSIPPNPVSILNYLCLFPPIPGKFDAQRAKSLGLVSGPHFARLKVGETVECPIKGGSSRLVAASECVADPTPGPGIAIVDCPAVEFIDSLISHPAWSKFQSQSRSDASRDKSVPMPLLTLIYHFTPFQILNNPSYQAFLHSFPAETRHVFANSILSPQRSYMFSHRKLISDLSQRFPHAFSPYHRNSDNSTNIPTPTKVSPALLSEWQRIHNLTSNSIIGESLLRFTLVPVSNQKFENPGAAKADELDQIEDANFAAAVRTQNKPFSPQLVFLGTGSAIPSCFRNVSSIYFEPREGISMFLDCGEASFSQLAHKFGLESALKRVSDTSIVFISHIHADHHLGLLTILAIRKQLLIKQEKEFNERQLIHNSNNNESASSSSSSSIPNSFEVPPLYLIGPNELFRWIRDYQHFADSNEIDYLGMNGTDGNQVIQEWIERAKANSSAGSANARTVNSEIQLLSGVEFIDCQLLSRWFTNDYHTFIHNSADFSTDSIEDFQPQESAFAVPDMTETPLKFKDYLNSIGINLIETCKVKHCYASYGIVITSNKFHDIHSNSTGLAASSIPSLSDPDYYRLVYSGDCRPSLALAEAGLNATILIHETTFDDSLISEARAKRHSTFSEAAAVARVMKAQVLIATHFSQRYPKFTQHTQQVSQNSSAKPESSGEANNQANSSMVDDSIISSVRPDLLIISAVDLLTVRFDTIEMIARDNAEIQELIGEEEEDEENNEENDIEIASAEEKINSNEKTKMDGN